MHRNASNGAADLEQSLLQIQRRIKESLARAALERTASRLEREGGLHTFGLPFVYAMAFIEYDNLAGDGTSRYDRVIPTMARLLGDPSPPSFKDVGNLARRLRSIIGEMRKTSPKVRRSKQEAA